MQDYSSLYLTPVNRSGDAAFFLPVRDGQFPTIHTEVSMNKSLAILFATLSFAVAAHAADEPRGPRATPATPAMPATHEAGKPAEPPKATPAIPAQPAMPAAGEHEDKGKHKGASKGKKAGQH
jgi:hypothetical protein